METLQDYVQEMISTTSLGSHQQGTARGAILNAVKLTYNPSQTQRDQLYSNRINPIIFSLVEE